ncbi:MAG: putative glycolipid-binding domain-containing protein [Pseudomonadota bacterium]
MQKTVVWKPWNNPGVENLRLTLDDMGVHATGQLMQSLEGQSIVASYGLNYDPRWRFRNLWLKADNQGQRSLQLQRDIRGTWFHNGEPRTDLNDCQTVMLSASPFTHTALLQRSALESGQSVEQQVAYVDLMTFQVQARVQRYRHLGRHEGGIRYNSEAEGTPSNALTVDEHALVRACNQYQRISARTLTPAFA